MSLISRMEEEISERDDTIAAQAQRIERLEAFERRLAYLRDNPDVYLRSTADGTWRAYTTDHDKMFDPSFATGKTYEEAIDKARGMEPDAALAPPSQQGTAGTEAGRG